MKNPRDTAQDAVHQAVDVAFSVADLLGGLFSLASGEESSRREFLLTRRRDDGGGVKLCLDTGTQPLKPPYLFNDGSADAYVTVTSPVALTPEQRSRVSDDLPATHYAQSFFLPQGGQQYPLPHIGDMTRGIFTTTLIDASGAGDQMVPMMAVTARNLLNHQASLTSDLSLVANSAGITLTSLQGAAVSVDATLVSPAPVHQQTQSSDPLDSTHGNTTLNLPFDQSDLASPLMESLTYVIQAPLGYIYQAARK
jgi:hypothetical protein